MHSPCVVLHHPGSAGGAVRGPEICVRPRAALNPGQPRKRGFREGAERGVANP